MHSPTRCHRFSGYQSSDAPPPDTRGGGSVAGRAGQLPRHASDSAPVAFSVDWGVMG